MWISVYIFVLLNKFITLKYDFSMYSSSPPMDSLIPKDESYIILSQPVAESMILMQTRPILFRIIAPPGFYHCTVLTYTTARSIFTKFHILVLQYYLVVDLHKISFDFEYLTYIVWLYR